MNLEYRLANAESILKIREWERKEAEELEAKARQEVQILRSKIALKVEVSNDD